ncbi:hypothetical protein NA56DRAFT_710244 [Hyaloscypha hepaticicola]|uniref:Uncharacterized protein n=1 Tax=Hyaloscypha hepaticicola TaxID=2082293 RepID=A0A2J6PM04_9HELO|nr:hypothetical protein NA56DRAFT_710244 [Hyaloscypha hepaticicola]
MPLAPLADGAFRRQAARDGCTQTLTMGAKRPSISDVFDFKLLACIVWGEIGCPAEKEGLMLSIIVSGIFGRNRAGRRGPRWGIEEQPSPRESSNLEVSHHFMYTVRVPVRIVNCSKLRGLPRPLPVKLATMTPTYFLILRMSNLESLSREAPLRSVLPSNQSDHYQMQ